MSSNELLFSDSIPRMILAEIQSKLVSKDRLLLPCSVDIPNKK